MDEALDVELHLQRAMPVLEGEHGAPVQPEVRVQHFVIEEIGDGAVVQLFVRGEEEFHYLHGSLVGKPELAVGVRVLAAVYGSAAQRVVGILLVQPVVLVQNADTRVFDGRDGTQQIPHHLEVIVHLAPAAHYVALAGKVGAVACAARNRVFLQDMDVATGHLRIAHQVAGSAQRRQAGAHDVGVLVLDALGLLGAGECFVVSAGVIHEVPSHRTAAPVAPAGLQSPSEGHGCNRCLEFLSLVTIVVGWGSLRYEQPFGFDKFLIKRRRL